jgi:hypothetical protein
MLAGNIMLDHFNTVVKSLVRVRRIRPPFSEKFTNSMGYFFQLRPKNRPHGYSGQQMVCFLFEEWGICFTRQRVQFFKTRILVQNRAKQLATWQQCRRIKEMLMHSKKRILNYLGDIDTICRGYFFLVPA